MAITSELIGKLGGADVETIPVSGTAPGSSSAVMTTITAPPGETLLVAVVGTITAANGSQLYIPVLSIGNAKASFSGVGEPVNVPNAVAGDYYFDTESGELHKITGV